MTSKLARWALAACHAENFLNLYLNYPEMAKQLEHSEVRDALEQLSQCRIEMLADCGDTQPDAGEPVVFDGKTVADRLDQMADAQPSGSPAQSDLYAAATVWRKHLAPPAAAHGESASEQHRNDMADTIVSLRTEIAALRRNAAAHGDEAEPSVDFAAWLIDHREGQAVTEEDMHEWLGEWYEQRLAMRAQAGEGESA